MRSLILLLLLLLLISTNAFGLMTARELRQRATKDRLARQHACISNFEKDVEIFINDAVDQEENSVTTSCYACHCGLHAFAKKLEKLGYKVEFQECPTVPKTKQLFISW